MESRGKSGKLIFPSACWIANPNERIRFKCSALTVSTDFCKSWNSSCIDNGVQERFIYVNPTGGESKDLFIVNLIGNIRTANVNVNWKGNMILLINKLQKRVNVLHIGITDLKIVANNVALDNCKTFFSCRNKQLSLSLSYYG